MVKTVFCGSPEFAARSLKFLVDHHCPIVGVVTMPDKKQGRGQRIAFNPVKQVALAYDLPVLQPAKATDPQFLNALQVIEPELVVVVAYGKLLRPQFLEIPKYGCINLHASYLPQYRGASPIHQTLLNGDDVTGVTTFMINEEMDSGDMILRKKIPVAYDETLGSLHDKLAKSGAHLLLKTIELFDTGIPPLTPQQHDEATYTTKITPEMAIIDWEQPAETIRNQIRAFNPAPGARSTLPWRDQPTQLKIFNADVFAMQINIQPGTIIEVTPESIVVACGTDALKLNEVQLAGKKRMSTQDFLRGNPITAGIVFDAQ